MDFKHLEYFYEVCAHQSISQAAKNLFISQQALSQCMQKLEESVGKTLFTRTKKGIQLTKDGYFLYHQFKPVLMNYRQALGNIHSYFHPVDEEFTLFCSPDMLWMLDLNLFEHFQKLHPQGQLKVEILNDFDCKNLIINSPQALGLISTFSPINSPKIKHLVVKEYPLLLFFRENHPLSTQEHIRFEDLASYPFLAGAKSSDYHCFLQTLAAQHHCPLHFGFETNDVGIIINLLKQTDQISFGTAPVATNQLLAGIEMRPFPTIGSQTPTASSCFIFQNSETLSPYAKCLISFIQEHL